VKGKLYLIPVTLGSTDYKQVIPEAVIRITGELRFFIAENIRSARRYLRLIDREFPIDASVFFELSEHTKESEITGYLDPADEGNDIGLLSEAGLPCLADPGSKIVSMAHGRNIKVVPLTGPSSVILALIASGLNGQNFTFNGYLPVKQEELSPRIREIERKARSGVTQIFMETPYRNQKLFEALMSVCTNDTKLCIAENITLPDEMIRTLKISEWKRVIPDLKDKLVIFLIQ
jgi:16S rRNA (cytidine1402-2'-O)-methyltransferase